MNKLLLIYASVYRFTIHKTHLLRPLFEPNKTIKPEKINYTTIN